MFALALANTPPLDEPAYAFAGATKSIPSAVIAGVTGVVTGAPAGVLTSEMPFPIRFQLAPPSPLRKTPPWVPAYTQSEVVAQVVEEAARDPTVRFVKPKLAGVHVVVEAASLKIPPPLVPA